jgi:hypothetical protein
VDANPSGRASRGRRRSRLAIGHLTTAAQGGSSSRTSLGRFACSTRRLSASSSPRDARQMHAGRTTAFREPQAATPSRHCCLRLSINALAPSRGGRSRRAFRSPAGR